MYNNYQTRNSHRWENENQDNLTKYSKDMDKLKYAEELMKNISQVKGKNSDKITSNQMRIVLSLFVNVRNDLQRKEKIEELAEDELYKIKYIKVKLIYQISRMNLKDFLKKSYLNEMLDDVKTREDFYNLVDYVEALVAYQKYYMNK